MRTIPQVCGQAALVALLLSIPAATAREPAGSDVAALVNFGPRVTGTAAAERASAYLLTEYRQAGYVARLQTFTYSRFEDLGSNLRIDGRLLEGRALAGSAAGTLEAPLVAVPNLGRPADFSSVNVRGAVAVVRRGEIRFLEKARNAAAAGAVGLVIVNSRPGPLVGSLGGEVNIPVLTVSGSSGEPLLSPVQASQPVVSQPVVTLRVNGRQRIVVGRNVIAHLPGVTQPSALLGGHYDSVPGSPGANDNASGTITVLTLARRLANTPLARQVWFVAFDGEEDGLHGSRALVSQAEPEFLRGLKAMLNFDMVGVNDQLLVAGADPLVALVKQSDPGIATFRSDSGSDHTPFQTAGVPTLFFHRGPDPNYHSPRDLSVDPKLLNTTAQLAAEVLQNLLER